MPKDYYDILGVSRNATETEIRAAYRKLAHKYHPDKTGGDRDGETKLKEINEAYAVLKNKEKRAQYDRFGPEGAQFGGGAGFGGFGGASPFDDIFDAFFGGGMGRGRHGGAAPMPGDDLEYRTTITLSEAAAGVSRHLQFARRETCDECRGSGAASASDKTSCPACGGAGQVRMTQGFFSISRACARCRGTGTVITKPCAKCRGAGVLQVERELAVDIPAGVDSGSRLRIPGEGEPGRNNGPRGDLYVLIEVENHHLFERHGSDLLCEIPISMSTAILGKTIQVPTLDGEANLKIPPGTQSGTVFRLRGKGLPDVRGYRIGDQLVHIQVETPAKLNREQRELIERFEELSSNKTYPLHQRFLDRIKASLGKTGASR